MEIIIDLTTKQRGTKNIGLLWNIEVEPRKESGFLAKIFNKNHQRVDRNVSLAFGKINVDNNLVCDENKLFTVVLNGNEYYQENLPVQVPLTQLNNNFQLFANLDAITDCKERQQRIPKTYSIDFELNVLDEYGQIIDSRNERLEVKFVSLNIKPNVKLNLEEDHLQYDSQLQEVKIGQLCAWIDERYAYTPHINLTTELGLFAKGKPLNDILYFKVNGNRVTSISTTLQPSRKKLKRFDVFMDFTHVTNPIEHEKLFNIVRRSKFSIEYSPEIEQPLSEENDELYLVKDDQGTELKVSVTETRVGTQSFVQNGDTTMLATYTFVPKSQMQTQVEILLSNIATDSGNPRAGLYIKNLMVADTVSNNLHILDDRDRELSQFTSIDGDDAEMMMGGQVLFIRNGVNAGTKINLKFNPSRIANVIPDFSFKVESTLSFDYCENKDGLDVNELEFSSFRMPIVWQLHLAPYPEWLCVDYGSSAIVCKYANSLVNLKERKEEIYEDPKNKYENFSEDNFEKDSIFLSSDILFHTTDDTQDFSSLCSEQGDNGRKPYSSLAVCLSPTSSLVMSTPATQIPCLKILVGNKFLPSNPFYENLRYPRLSASGQVERVTMANTLEEDNSLMRISTILKEAYSAMFGYFVSPTVGDLRRVNKMVLTYPNTYTPVHLNILKGIVKETFPYLRDGYLRFVSESDAVASYYISHWDHFNPGRSIMDFNENVLVYDMGAGTLDVTIFEKNVRARRVEGNIIGKLGTGKAGNYLDFILAEIIAEKLELDQILKSKVASTTFAANPAVLKERHNLKEFVKYTVKPGLARSKSFKYKVGGINKTISADDIINDSRFQEFLEDVTNGIINQLIQYINRNDLMIDTVIMSGRSCNLSFLREKLKKVLDEQSSNEIHFVEFQNAPGENQEKTIVVEGAVANATWEDHEASEVTVKSRRLYASYGLVYQGLGGSHRYVELINHNDIPYNDVTGGFDSSTTKVEGTANSNSIKLIQTYLSAKETEIAFNNNNFEFISEMEEYDMANFSNAGTLNVKLHFDRNNNVSLYVNGLVSTGNAPKGVDLTSEITKRSIWPVTINSES